jgi:DNA polymerase III delta subunit
LWDKKEVTKLNMAKLANKAKVSLSKPSTLLFTFLESLHPGNSKPSLAHLHDLRSTTDDLIVFTMIARQISYLIMIKSGTSPKFAPWQIGKLKAQGAQWSDKQLADFLAKLLDIDFSIKTGRSKLSYTDHLDLLLHNLLG